MRHRVFVVFALITCPAFAQLATEQKLLDFQGLAANFAKRYAFTEWKVDAVKFDSLNIAPWLDRVRQSASDVEFFEICAEYVAKNQDGHTAFVLPSDFDAYLPFDVDLYDGKFVIDDIDRRALPTRLYPFAIGDELVSIDGVSAAELAAKLSIYVGDGNPRAVQRLAATFLAFRPQWLVPRAAETADTANVVIKRQNGTLATYQVSWTKEGNAYTQAGPVPVPKTKQADTQVPPYLRHVMNFQRFRRAVTAPRSRQNADGSFSTGVDDLRPVFAMPDGFVQRLGNGYFDTLFTGTYTSGGKKIGYMRIPDFEYVSSTDLTNEIKNFEANTDGLVVDIMRNPGGSGCQVEKVMSYLNPGGFYSIGNKIRATWDLIMALQFDLEDADYYGATADEIAFIEQFLTQAQKAFAQNRGFTTPQPLCGTSIAISSAHDKAGNEIAYSKPILVLTDELSASAAEIFAAVMQDEGRAMLYGFRTDGAGGSVAQVPVGVYMESYLSYAQSILTRKRDLDTGGEFPTMPYIENIGVRPDKVDDYMTLDNLLNQGKPFVDRFTQAMLDWIGKKSGSAAGVQ
ncbi:MAG TPA: S41 family peptidase [Candidatus Solibacter sp.]|nr:S41 family peptidase [Candidatus Solibacter sp.]